jgi:hypothetical protein
MVMKMLGVIERKLKALENNKWIPVVGEPNCSFLKHKRMTKTEA